MEDTRTPVHVVTGFLGAGKTTLLRQAMQDPRLSNSLLLVNEVADLGVDDRLLRLDGTEAVLLANGCLCCTVNEALGDTLRAIVESEHAASLSRVIVETTGLADPLPVISTIAIHPFLSARLRVEMVVTVVDAQHADASAEAPEFMRQIQAADVVMLSKTDLATAEQTERARALIAQHNPLCSVQSAAEISLADLTGQAVEQRADRLASGLFSALNGGESTGSTDKTRMRIGRRATNSPQHTASISTFCIELGEDLDWMRLAAWLSLLLHSHGTNILRLKGLVALERRDAPVVINGVRHVIHFPEHLHAWPDGERRSFLVFIVRDLVPDLVLRSFLACVQRTSFQHTEETSA